MAPYDTTQQWHHVHCNPVPGPIRQRGSSPSPPFEVKTRIAIIIWRISDAKSVYDALLKPINKASVINSKRIAIALALLRDELKYWYAGIR